MRGTGIKRADPRYEEAIKTKDQRASSGSRTGTKSFAEDISEVSFSHQQFIPNQKNCVDMQSDYRLESN